MKIGLVDVDGHNFPNLVLMKLSAWHKRHGDTVEWYEPLLGGHYNKVYMSKVFSFTDDYEYPVHADEVVKGGTGYNIKLVDGKEVYTKDTELPYEIEHIMPDYSLYNITDTAYGYMTRGCPRGCDFCIVKEKEGSGKTVARLEEFWSGQKNIVLLDPNFFCVKEWRENAEQLIASKAVVDFTQGVDIRTMTAEKAEYIKQIRIKTVHFAWDNYNDKDIVVPRLKEFIDTTGFGCTKVAVYVLTNFNTTIEQDLERIYTIRDLGANPYLMIYNKYNLPKNHVLKAMQEWVNYKPMLHSVEKFEDYLKIREERQKKKKDKGETLWYRTI